MSAYEYKNPTNRKITINEVDSTQPKGEGISSDIVYVPGVTPPLDNANYNVPVYCTSVSQFESYFGKMPYEFTAEDIKSNKTYIDAMGDYWTEENPVDISYVYAKELLSSGLPVYYESLSSSEVVEESHIVQKNVAKDYPSPLGYPLRASFKGTSEREGEPWTVTIPVSLYSQQDETDPFRNYNSCIIDTSLIEEEFQKINSGFSFDSKFTIIDEYKNIDTYSFVDDKRIEIKFNPSYNPYNGFKLQTVITCSLADNIKVDILEFAVSSSVNVTTYESVTETIMTEKRLPCIEGFYKAFENAFKTIADKSEYTVKYLTAGGYPVLTMDTKANETIFNPAAEHMLACAANRGDAVAILDHSDNVVAPLGVAQKSIYDILQATNYKNPEYGTMFTPWGNYSTTFGNIAMPASFGYLSALATAIKTQPNWLAVAGIARGGVPGLQSLRTTKPLTNTIAEDYQPKFGTEDNTVSMNAITNVKPYGLTIWGNRTLYRVDPKGTTAHNFLNTRNMISDIKKLSYTTAKSLMFEQDSDILWLRFKSGVTPLLDRLKGGFGISDYKIIKLNTKFNGESLTNGEISAVIKIFPLYAIEYFEITVQIADQDVAIS